METPTQHIKKSINKNSIKSMKWRNKNKQDYTTYQNTYHKNYVIKNKQDKEYFKGYYQYKKEAKIFLNILL